MRISHEKISMNSDVTKIRTVLINRRNARRDKNIKFLLLFIIYGPDSCLFKFPKRVSTNVLKLIHAKTTRRLNTQYTIPY